MAGNWDRVNQEVHPGLWGALNEMHRNRHIRQAVDTQVNHYLIVKQHKELVAVEGKVLVVVNFDLSNDRMGISRHSDRPGQGLGNSRRFTPEILTPFSFWTWAAAALTWDEGEHSRGQPEQGPLGSPFSVLATRCLCQLFILHLDNSRVKPLKSTVLNMYKELFD